MSDAPLRIGTLGAARITPTALLRPAHSVAEAEVVAVAARDRARAEKFARKHGIAKVHASYDELIADPDVDAIYNPLPNGLHHDWTIRALDAGKHVLCEKPLASNADEAEQMAQAAQRNGRILGEAFHWRYHPLAARMREIIDSGELGAIRHVEGHLCIPLPIPGDIRYRWHLAGGAGMDTGCYAVSVVRFLADAEPEVVRASAKLSSPKVDRYLEADFRFADGRTGRMSCALFSAVLLRARARAVGDAGELDVLNPIAPQLFHRLSVKTNAGHRVEKLKGEASYTGQLRAFVAAVRSGEPMPTDGRHGVRNMAVIDAIYRAAGLPVRGT